MNSDPIWTVTLRPYIVFTGQDDKDPNRFLECPGYPQFKVTKDVDSSYAFNMRLNTGNKPVELADIANHSLTAMIIGCTSRRLISEYHFANQPEEIFFSHGGDLHTQGTVVFADGRATVMTFEDVPTDPNDSFWHPKR